MDCSDWSNGIQYQIFDTRPDTEFNDEAGGPCRLGLGDSPGSRNHLNFKSDILNLNEQLFVSREPTTELCER